MRAIVFLGLLMLAVPVAAALPPCNSGTVFEDRNGNGSQDQAEPGVPGVKVSDGVELVTSDASGRYQLPVVDGRSIFMIKPIGYSLASRANGLPDYWRNLRTAPGPSLKYGGIPA
ncbi:MAG: metallophosphoesterase N-terminal domain-containing protein, partial [Lysobacter sp.]